MRSPLPDTHTYISFLLSYILLWTTFWLTNLKTERAEKTATAMESQLADLEKKIDDLLASVDLPTALVHNPIPAGEGLRKESDEGSSSAERNRLEKGEEEETPGNKKMTEKGSK